MNDMGWITLGVTVFIAWSGVMVGTIKWLIDRGLTSSNERHQRLHKRVDDLEGELRKLAIELPDKYVQRGDWIRLATSIDAKMDALNTKLDDLKDRLYERN